jgi:hypothetical protein
MAKLEDQLVAMETETAELKQSGFDVAQDRVVS